MMYYWIVDKGGVEYIVVFGFDIVDQFFYKGVDCFVYCFDQIWQFVWVYLNVGYL